METYASIISIPKTARPAMAIDVEVALQDEQKFLEHQSATLGSAASGSGASSNEEDIKARLQRLSSQTARSSSKPSAASTESRMAASETGTSPGSDGTPQTAVIQDFFQSLLNKKPSTSGGKGTSRSAAAAELEKLRKK